jgi:hypothetical protein
MQYKSPFYLISTDLEHLQIKQEKKKILAQFELNDDNPIKAGNLFFNKSDILKIVDEFANIEIAKFHLQIFNNKALLSFLERGEVDIKLIELFDDNSLKNDDFINFITPCFVSQYNDVLYKSFSTRDYKKMELVSKIPILSNESGYDECFRKTYNEFNQLVERLKREVNEIDNNKNPYNLDQKTIPNKELIKTINELPDYFDKLINTYTRLLVDLTIDCYDYDRKELAIKLIVLINKIECDQQVKGYVSRIYNQIQRFKPQEIDREENNGNKGKLMIITFGLILSFIICLAILSTIIKPHTEILDKFLNINCLDTLVKSYYKKIPDSSAWLHRNVFDTKKQDSIINSKQKTVAGSMEWIMEQSPKPVAFHSDKSSFYLFSSDIVEFRNQTFKNFILIRNKTPYDLIYFIIFNDKIISNSFIGKGDTLYCAHSDNSMNYNEDFDLWFYFGNNMKPEYEISYFGKKVGLGFRSQPINYLGFINPKIKINFTKKTKIENNTFVIDYQNAEVTVFKESDSIRYDHKINYLHDSIVKNAMNPNLPN